VLRKFLHIADKDSLPSYHNLYLRSGSVDEVHQDIDLEKWNRVIEGFGNFSTAFHGSSINFLLRKSDRGLGY
jgi:hypothetical protein